MNNRYVKLILSLALCIALCIAFTVPAYAAPNTRFAAWIMAMLQALNISLTSATMPALDLLNYLSDPFEVNYTYTDDFLNDYFNQAVIQITPDLITIDGEDYGEIWLSKDAADKFRVNAFDFASAYDIASNTNGTFAEGVGTINSVPIFEVDGVYRSQDYKLINGDAFYVGDFQYTTQNYSAPYYYVNAIKPNGTSYRFNSSVRGVADARVTSNQNLSQYWLQCLGEVDSSGTIATQSKGPFNDAVVDPTPFDFDWVAMEIEAEPIPDDQGLSVKVPMDTLEPIFTNYPDQTGAPITIDTSLPWTPDFLDDLGDLIRDILMDPDLIIPIVIAPPGQVTPDPDPDPVDPAPGTLIPATPWENLSYRLDRIIERITQIPETIRQTISNVTETIEDLGDTISQSISDLGDQIITDIEKGPIELFDKVLDAFKTVFAPIFASLKSFLGIWHYVVEWIASISIPFLWILGVLSGTSYYIVLPIYAGIAGIIVIAIYKKIGR